MPEARLNPFLLFLLLISTQLTPLLAQEDSLQAAQVYQLADSLYKERDFGAAAEKYGEASRQFESLGIWESAVAALKYQGYTYYQLREYQQADSLMGMALAMGKEKLGNDHIEVGYIYNLMGISAYGQGDNNRAMALYQNSLDIKLKQLPPYHPTLASTYNNLGNVYRKTGNLEKSQAAYEKALELHSHNHGPDHPFVGDCWFNLGTVNRAMNNFKKAIECDQEALRIYRASLGENHLYVAETYTNMGAVFYDWEKFAEAQKSYEKALSILRINYEEPFYLYSYIYNGLASVLAGQRKLDEAMQRYNEALRVTIQGYGEDHINTARILENMGNIYRMKGQFDQAWSHYKKALEICSLASVPEDPASPPPLATVENKIFYLGLLREINWFLLEKAESNPEQAQGFRETFKLSERIVQKVDTIRLRYTDETSKEILAGDMLPVYECAIRSALHLEKINDDSREWLEVAFRYMEKSKASVLYEAITGMENRQIAGIPPSLQTEEANLKAEIGALEGAYFQALGSTEADSAEIFRLRNQRFDLIAAYDELMDNIDRRYPDYFRLRYELYNNTLSEVAGSLAPGTAILEYTEGQKGLAILMISKDGVQGYLVADTTLDREVRDWRAAVLNNQISGVEATGELLSRLLLDPFWADLPVGTKRLIFIPDGSLGYLPFEALKTPDTGEYLIETLAISYAYSAHLLLEQQELVANITAPGGYAGFAADYGSGGLVLNAERGTSLPPLKGAVQEITEVAELTGGDAFTKSEATETAFRNQAPRHRVLHLAMHALVNDDEPLQSALRFTPEADSTKTGALHAWELYQMQLNARLAVLSACNTGFGELKRGEGIMSLSRAFTQAKCPTTVMTLWQVPDQASARLVPEFFKGLKAGKTVDQAMREAKLTYLAEAAAPELRQPYYWAGFIPAGAMDPVSFEKEYPLEMLFLLAIIVLGGAWAAFQTRKKG